MTDTNTDPNYQDILNKYSQDLANNNSDPEIPQNPPEPESAPLTEVEPTLVEEPVNTLDSPPSDLPPTFPQPEPQLQPEPQPQPEPVASNPIIDTEIPSESINPPPETPKSNNFFKYLFFFSLFAFIVVLILVIRSFLNSQSSSTIPVDSNEVPSITPIVSQQTDNYCVFNDQYFTIGQQFEATDGCNTCVCGEDLQISCSGLTCPATQSSIEVPPTSTATASPTVTE